MRQLDGADVARRINEAHPGTAISWNSIDVWIEPEDLLTVGGFLHDDPDLDFATLRAVTAVDYVEYFELIYHLLSMRKNHCAVLKTKRFGRDEPAIDSVVDIWKGAELQEREVWDLMGIHFEGHPNMKRVLLWEGFPGHPLRKDFIR